MPEWEELLERFKQLIETSGKSHRQIAAEAGIANVTVRRLIDSPPDDPQGRTKDAVLRWVVREEAVRAGRGEEVRYVDAITDADEALENFRRSEDVSPEQQLIDFFLEYSPQMATFMSLTTRGLTPEDRRKVAVAIFNGFKQLAIEAGEKLPPWFFELEGKFVGDPK